MFIGKVIIVSVRGSYYHTGIQDITIITYKILINKDNYIQIKYKITICNFNKKITSITSKEDKEREKERERNSVREREKDRKIDRQIDR